jgi:DNA-binding response OmpR family regulator
MSAAARVLVIDDDPDVLELVTGFLTLHGYEVLTAGTAGEGLMLLSVAFPDVVLLDISMPRVDGVTALRRIRMDHSEIPVVMLTGNTDVSLARDTLKHGAFDYVTKPMDFSYLRTVIEAAVARRPCAH